MCVFLFSSTLTPEHWRFLCDYCSWRKNQKKKNPKKTHNMNGELPNFNRIIIISHNKRDVEVEINHLFSEFHARQSFGPLAQLFQLPWTFRTSFSVFVSYKGRWSFGQSCECFFPSLVCDRLDKVLDLSIGNDRY